MAHISRICWSHRVLGIMNTALDPLYPHKPPNQHLVKSSKCQGRLWWLSWRRLTLLKTWDFLWTIVVSLFRGIPFHSLSLFQDKALSPCWRRHHYHVLEFLNLHPHLLITDICDHSLCLSHSSKSNCSHLCPKRTVAHVSVPQGAQGPTCPSFLLPNRHTQNLKDQRWHRHDSQMKTKFCLLLRVLTFQVAQLLSTVL